MEIGKSFNRILIADSTSFKLPEELADLFRGSGGNASDAAVKIQFCYDLKSEQFFYIVEDGTSPDNKYENNFVNQVEEGDLIISDLGYFNKNVFVGIAGKGGYYPSRWKTGVNLYVKDENGKMTVLDLVKFFSRVSGCGVFDIEAVKQANAALIGTIEDSLAIADEGKARRADAEVELKKMEADLRDTLAAAKARKDGVGDNAGTAVPTTVPKG